MSRITAPVAKQLSRSLNPAVVAGSRSSSGLLDHNAGDALMPKYAELLRNRRSGETSDPSIANRPKPLMQTFHTSRPAAAAVSTTAANLDSIVLPSMSALSRPSASSDDLVVPILPDNYAAAADNYVVDAPTEGPEITIVAADPDKVLPSSPFSEVASAGIDGIDLGFAHDSDPAQAAPARETDGGMLRDVWKGMVSDIFGTEEPQKKAI